MAAAPLVWIRRRLLPGAADGIGLLADPLLRRLLISGTPLHLAKHALALHLLLQDAQRLFDIVVADENLHSDFLRVTVSWKQKRAGLIPTLPQLSCAERVWRRYIRGRLPLISYAGQRVSSLGAQVVGRHLARALVLDELVRDLLTIAEVAHASALDGADVDEHVLTAIIRLNEAETLGPVEPFHCATGHNQIPSCEW
jgi:hypothetical protein